MVSTTLLYNVVDQSEVETSTRRLGALLHGHAPTKKSSNRKELQ